MPDRFPRPAALAARVADSGRVRLCAHSHLPDAAFRDGGTVDRRLHPRSDYDADVTERNSDICAPAGTCAASEPTGAQPIVNPASTQRCGTPRAVRPQSLARERYVAAWQQKERLR